MPVHDPWLLPTRQQELPLKESIPATRLHGRREGTFLVLAGLFLIATAASVLGGRPVLDLTALVFAWTGLSIDVAMQLPLGVLAFPLGFLMIALVCDLYTPRRARAVVVFGAVASVALIGLTRLSDVATGGEHLFAPALAMTACYFVAYVAYVEIFDAARKKLRGRHLWLRSNLSALIAQIGGWAAFGLAAYFYATRAQGASYTAAMDQVTALVIGACAYTTAFVLVATLPLAITSHVLEIYLRVGDDVGEVVYGDDDDRAHDRPVVLQRPRKAAPRPAIVADEDDGVPEPVALQPRRRTAMASRPPAVVVDDDPPPHPTRRAARPSIPPYSSAEMRFFTEGEQLAEGSDVNDASTSGVRARA